MSDPFVVDVNVQNRNEDSNVIAQAMSSRYIQEVQGMIIMAKKFPRDQFAAYNRIMEACKRKSLAEVAQYEFPRGGEKVTGPSIRLAEVLAQNWGNISTGIIELEQNYGESKVMAFAWDLETNYREERIFTVKHERKAKGVIKKLDDPRDIYELVANLGARRKRSCILAVIPKDIVEAAEAQCEETLKKSNAGKPLVDRIRDMFAKFQADFGVTKDMIEEFIGCRAEAFTERDILRLGRVYNSLRDGMAKREDFFNVKATSPEPEKAEALKKDLAGEGIEVIGDEI
ncbi:MAG TPA: hypothetical protein GXX37_12300 [Clostridiaceae bacterium]|nr:hypothetical protein [Clostridiaceae bacterium]